jgi:hypothetical protein
LLVTNPSMKNSLIALFLFVLCSANAQTKGDGSYKDLVQEGNYLSLEENYSLALQNYLLAFAMDSSSALLNYNIGICYLNTLNQKNKAEAYLERAVRKVDKNCVVDNPLERSAPPLAHYYYGQALHMNYKFDEELKQYELFEKYVSPKDKEWRKNITRDKEICAFAKLEMEGPMNVMLTNLGDSVNSEFPDYSPVLTADERMLIFTTSRPNTTGGLKDDSGKYNEDVVVSYKDDKGNWSAPRSISDNINGSGMDAAINISPDGQTLIIYRDGGDGMGGNIYYSTFDGEGWSPLKEFGSDVNTKYWESHACLNADGTVLIFVSNRPGGFGGRDLYRCVKLPTGNWSKALNMGPVINTEYDEDGAFIHPDGRTFFFASNGHKTMGGFDIMFATLDENNQFSDVQNMGYPINTTDDDVFYVTSPDGKRGYFSSAKEGGFGEKDLYMVSIPEAREKPLALFKGQIVPSAGEELPEDLMIIVKDKQTGEIIGTYRPRHKNGTFTTILPPGREYTFSYQAPQGNEFYSEDVFVSNDIAYKEINREIGLEPVKLVGKVKAKSNALLLNIVVMDNVKNKKPIEGAKITVTGSDGKVHEYSTNASGLHNNLPLTVEVEYKIVAELNGKKSEVATVSTKGIKPPKIYTSALYIEKASESAPGEYSLEVFVRNRKKKPIRNASVVLTDANGQKYEGTTDEKGMLKNIPIDTDLKYELSATIDNKASEKLAFSTNKLKPKAIIRKTLVIDESTTGAVAVADNVVPEGEYQFFFKYGRTKIDEEEAAWKSFVSKAAEMSKQKAITVDVYSSASRVPTRARGNNKGLASSRAKKTVEKLSAAISAAGGNTSNITFKRRSKVNGPKYSNDPRKRKKYEPYQYVKVKVF